MLYEIRKGVLININNITGMELRENGIEFIIGIGSEVKWFDTSEEAKKEFEKIKKNYNSRYMKGE